MVVPKAVSWKSIPNGMEEKVVEIWIASRDAWASEQVVSDPSLPSSRRRSDLRCVFVGVWALISRALGHGFHGCGRGGR